MMFRSVKVLHFTVAILCCFNAVIGHSSILVTNDELRDNACIVNDNRTLRNEFMAKARENTIISGSYVLSSKGRSKYLFNGVREDIQPYDQGSLVSHAKCVNRSEGAVMWCLHIWHHTETIMTCLNGTTQYSSPVAEALGIANDLEYMESCTVFGKSFIGCLRIKYVRLFHDHSFITATINEGDCIVNDFYKIILLGKTNTPTSLTTSPPYKQYREIGQKVTVECAFRGSFQYTSWKDSNGDNLYPLQEYPNCTLNSTSLSCNQFNSETIVAARQKRIRSYMLTSDSISCTNHQIKNVYLVIDNLQMSDEGDYTCYAISKSDKETSYTVMIIPVYPVYDPLIINRNETEVYVYENDSDNILVCEIEAGIDTQVYWQLPNGDIPEIDFWMENGRSCNGCNDSLPIVFGIDEQTDKYKIKYYRELIISNNIISNNDDKLSEIYKCIIKYDTTSEEVKYKVIEITLTYQPLPIITTNTSAILTSTVSYSTTITTSINTNEVILSITEASINRPSSDGQGGSMSLVFLLAIFVLSVLVVFVVVLSCIVIIVRRYKHRKIGNGVIADTNKESFFRQTSLIFRDKKQPSIISTFPSTAVNNMFFIENKEIPRDKIEFISKIDEGTFGQVMKAFLHNGKSKDDQVVAVKMVKDSVYLRVDDLNSIKDELEIMRNIRNHDNIVNMIGYCTSPDGPLCIVMEFVPLGNLKDYLRSISPHSPLSNPTHTRLINTSSNTSYSTCSSGYPLLPTLSSHTPLSAQPSEVSIHSYIRFSSDNATPCLSPPGSAQSSNGSDVSDCSPIHIWPMPPSNKQAPPRLADINFEKCALDIAEGLSHLQAMSVIHCDLAARNVLITEDFTLKIGDFGMAKILGQHKDYHRRCQKERIPVKWTAPEALENWKYTHKSDVWSYGIVLWEMLTFGNVPYIDIANRAAWEIMITYLKDGHRLHKPDNCIQPLYDVMSKCWSLLPEDRPTATELVTIIKELVISY